MTKTLSLILFFLVFAFDIVAVTIGHADLELWTKPILIPTLIAYVFAATERNRSMIGFALAALTLSWVGDCLLLGDKLRGSLFVYGLVAFLAGHVFYIVHFIKLRKKAGITSNPNIVAMVAIVAYSVALLYFLRPHLGTMMIPVIVYGAVISVMFASSIAAVPKGGARYASVGMVGALLFLASDSLLAVNKFAAPIEFAQTMTMLTYGLGQFLIAEGAIFATREIES